MKGILRTLAFTGILGAAAAAAQAQVGIAVRVGPPAPVVYDNYIPACPGVGFIWTPGYYAGRAWVPGRWMHRDGYVVAHRDYGFDHRGFDHRDYGYRGGDHGRR
jgi:WXXGXW repeat (2 copies)